MSDRDDYIIGRLEELQDGLEVLDYVEVYELLDHIITVLEVKD